jgi:4-hydroxybenzoate polyprenyltransferase
MVHTHSATVTPPQDGARAPLVVDLDGTLIFSDLLWETIVLFLKQHLLSFWRLPLWLLGGKVAFKQRIADAVTFDPAALPFDRELIDYLKQQKAQGRVIVLATGSHERLARQVAAHLGLFDLVLASGEGINLTSHSKADRLVREYGDRGFDYIGNSRADIAVWQRSQACYSVTARPFSLGDGRHTTRLGASRHAWGPALLQAMRPRQWLKNLLVFVPMLAGHALDSATLAASLGAFAVFCVFASSAYLLNDVLDAQDDRAHAIKFRRPVASGRLPVPVALAASIVLAIGGIALSSWLGPLLAVATGIYFLTTLWYSLQLKRLLMIDIVTLAILYSLRIVGGGAATGIVPSFWLMAFSFFIFLSLAMLKRYSELANLHRAGQKKTRGRGYSTDDAVPLGALGINAAMMSVLILMLYINSATVWQQYRHPVVLVLCVPLLVFWLGRLWLLAYRGKVNEDPVLYVSKDKVSLAIVAACLACGAIAALMP